MKTPSSIPSSPSTDPSSPSTEPSSSIPIHSVLKKQKVDYDSLHEAKVDSSDDERDGEGDGESDGERFNREFVESYFTPEEKVEAEESYTKYITQVEASDGFDLDHSPKVRFFGQISRVHLDEPGSDEYPTFGDFMKHLSICALDEYNRDKEEQLVFERVEKATFQLEIGPVFRITFLVKDASLQSKVFQAKVGVMGPTEIDVKLCRPKP